MSGPWYDNEGRDSESSRAATRAVLTRPWVLALLVLALVLVICGALARAA